MNRRTAIAASITLLIAAASLGGCCDVRHDLTPEMMTLSQRPVDVDNAISLAWNEDIRMMWSDLARATLTDRPVRLTPESVPH
jgi:hypothetical protein